MPKLDMPAIRSLVQSRQPGRPLEAPFYLSREILELDLEVIFGRHWIFVGVEPDVPEPGDYASVQIGRNPVVIVRDDDMQVRAFHNVCRHRGARLVTEPQGTVGKLVCPYHQWTYELDGSLIHAEHMAPDFDLSCHGLKKVHLRSLAGLLFVCLADEPPADFDEMARTLEPYIAPHGIADAKVAARVDLVEEGNWKLTMENNRECYHCATNHPELTISLFEYGYGFAPESADESRCEAMAQYARTEAEFETAWEAHGLAWQERDELHGRPTAFRAQRLPLDRAGESQTLDGRAASRKLMGSLKRAKLGGLSVWTQPNSWVHLMSDHVVTFSVLPLSADRTLLRTTWLVHQDAVEGVDYDPDNLTEVWRRTNEQDGALVGLAHSGVQSQAYEPGPYSPYTEGLVEKFVAWYIERLGAHLDASGR
ncbi:aromatic ring-hydroxylating dioxygenase subunit alpha (plasmid) [Geminicoccaceae bacterium 1502E]|nr:aromatic ring-hydroxylating dioxygenase subunit alpha [Geminicoccaceae bacterium 1502E]